MMLLGNLSACCEADRNPDTVIAAESVSEDETKQSLVNHMTERERRESRETELRLFDKPWESAAEDDDELAYLRTAVAMEIWDSEDYIADLYKDKEYYTEEEFSQCLAYINEDPELYNDKVHGFIVNGEPAYYMVPPAEYDGGAGKIYVNHYNAETGDCYTSELEFDDYAMFKELLRKDLEEAKEAGMDAPYSLDGRFDDAVTLMDAIIDGSVLRLDYGTMDAYREYYYEQKASGDIDGGAWVFDENEVSEFKGDIREFSCYDEELDRIFIIHVITPPGYDPSLSYGALVMTDAVWRFDDVAALRKEMETGESAPRILVTVGQDYALDNSDNDVRSGIFCVHKKEFLDFLCDNLMPYLSEYFDIDFSASCLFGHSQGGVFTHYAAFHSDLYENRPFAEYIIGSPTFWTPYFTDQEDWDEYKNDYGYFDRNDSLDRMLYLTGGASEDADYSEYYGENESTLEGLAHLKERLDRHHHTAYSYKIYPGHHSDYVRESLIQYCRGRS